MNQLSELRFHSSAMGVIDLQHVKRKERCGALHRIQSTGPRERCCGDACCDVDRTPADRVGEE